MSDVVVYLVKPPLKDDWDMGDILAVARSKGKKILKTHSNVRVFRLQFEPPFGFVAFAEKADCSRSVDCKRKQKRK